MRSATIAKIALRATHLGLLVVLGYVVACWNYTKEVWVDFGTGAIVTRDVIWPLTLREEEEIEAARPQPNWSPANSSSPEDWHLALRFRGKSRYSGSRLAGHVVHDIYTIRGVLICESGGARVAIARYIEILNTEGVDVARRYAMMLSTGVLQQRYDDLRATTHSAPSRSTGDPKDDITD